MAIAIYVFLFACVAGAYYATYKILKSYGDEEDDYFDGPDFI